MGPGPHQRGDRQPARRTPSSSRRHGGTVELVGGAARRTACASRFATPAPESRRTSCRTSSRSSTRPTIRAPRRRRERARARHRQGDRRGAPGQISCDSALGEGTTFTLAAADARSTRAAAPAQHRARGARGGLVRAHGSHDASPPRCSLGGSACIAVAQPLRADAGADRGRASGRGRSPRRRPTRASRVCRRPTACSPTSRRSYPGTPEAAEAPYWRARAQARSGATRRRVARGDRGCSTPTSPTPRRTAASHRRRRRCAGVSVGARAAPRSRRCRGAAPPTPTRPRRAERQGDATRRSSD